MVSQFCGACFRQKEEQMCVLVRCFAACVYGDIPLPSVSHYCPATSQIREWLPSGSLSVRHFIIPGPTYSVCCSQSPLSLPETSHQPVTMVDLWVISNSWYMTNVKCKVSHRSSYTKQCKACKVIFKMSTMSQWVTLYWKRRRKTNTTVVSRHADSYLHTCFKWDVGVVVGHKCLHETIKTLSLVQLRAC